MLRNHQTEKTPQFYKFITLLATVVFFSSLLVFFLKINLWDYDFWWHLATGKYIVTERHLPEKDPFSFSSELQENKNLFPERENLILKQYWLAQILFYFIFSLAGPKGIIFLRSLILVLTLFTVFWHLQKRKVSFYLSFLFVFLLFMVSRQGIGERPVLFSFLFTAILFSALEDFRVEKSRKIFLLPPLMLLWANMHGGFILGDVIIAVFLLGETIRILLKKDTFTRQEKIIFYSVSLFAIALSYVNPAGWEAFSVALSGKYEVFTREVQEYQSPFSFYIKKIRPLQFHYVVLAVMSPLILLVRNRKLNITHVLLLLGTYYMAATASRYVFFYAIVATMIVAKETDSLVGGFFRKNLRGSTYQRVEYLLTAAALCSISLYLIGHYKIKEFEFRIASKTSVPVAAVDFIEKNRLPGNIFNDYSYGGYLAWRLYPWKKNFIDSRGLNITTMTEYDWIVSATQYDAAVNPSASNTDLWKRLLTHYNINLILISPYDLTGNLEPLVLKIAESDRWVTIYSDPISLVLIKNVPENKPFIEKYKLSREEVYNSIMYKAVRSAFFDKTNPRSLTSLGEIFYKMGRLDDAITAYEYASQRMPESSVIRDRLNALKAEMQEGKDVTKSNTTSKPQ